MKKYAKILSVLLSLVMLLSAFAACGKEETPDEKTDPTKQEQQVDEKGDDEKQDDEKQDDEKQDDETGTDEPSGDETDDPDGEDDQPSDEKQEKELLNPELADFLYTQYDDKTILLSSLIDDEGVVRFSIPAVLDGKIVKIAEEAFSNMEDLEEVILCDGLLEIEEKAFSNCPRLKKIEIPDSVEKIEAYAFENCLMLSEVKLGDGLESIDDTAFSGCTMITFLDLGNGLTEVGDNLFKDATYSLVELTIGTSMEKTVEAFDECKKLLVIHDNAEEDILSAHLQKIVDDYEEDEFEPEIDEIDGYLFFTDVNGDTSLVAYIGEGDREEDADEDDELDLAHKYLRLPESYEDENYAIFPYAFYGRTDLEKVDLDGITEIGEHAFDGCSQLQYLVIPSSVTDICEGALDAAFIACLAPGMSEGDVENASGKKLLVYSITKVMNAWYYDKGIPTEWLCR